MLFYQGDLISIKVPLSRKVLQATNCLVSLSVCCVHRTAQFVSLCSKSQTLILQFLRNLLISFIIIIICLHHHPRRRRHHHHHHHHHYHHQHHHRHHHLHYHHRYKRPHNPNSRLFAYCLIMIKDQARSLS